MAASLKGRKKTVDTQTAKKSVKIAKMNKVEFSNNPSLKAFFQATITGYPVVTRVTFTEKQKDDSDTEEINPDDFGILFKSKVSEKTGIRYDFIHPIDGEVRKDIKLNVLKAFEKYFEEEKDVTVNEKNIKVSQVTEMNNFKGQLGDALVSTTRTMALESLELHQSKEGNYYLAYPARNVQDKNGEYHKYPYYWPQKESDTTQAILEMAVKEYENA